MIIPRSSVDDALLTLLKGAFQWKIASKHWVDWSNTTNQPALYIKRIQENTSQVLRGENKYVLKYEVWIYAQVDNSNPNVDPYDTVINPIMDAIDKVLSPQDTYGGDWQNLGLNQVANARISGTSDIGDGTLDGQACIVIPVEVWVGQ